MGFLFGDILTVTTTDLAIIWSGGAAVLAVLAYIWRFRCSKPRSVSIWPPPKSVRLK